MLVSNGIYCKLRKGHSNILEEDASKENPPREVDTFAPKWNSQKVSGDTSSMGSLPSGAGLSREGKKEIQIFCTNPFISCKS